MGEADERGEDVKERDGCLDRVRLVLGVAEDSGMVVAVCVPSLLLDKGEVEVVETGTVALDVEGNDWTEREPNPREEAGARGKDEDVDEAEVAELSVDGAIVGSDEGMLVVD